MEVLANTSPHPLCPVQGVYVQNVSQGPESRKRTKQTKNVPSHKGPSFLCFVSVSQSVSSFEEWNCRLFLVGLVAETGGRWLEMKLPPLRAPHPTAR